VKCPPTPAKRKPSGIGFAPWFGIIGMLAGLGVGLRLGRTLIPMQIGGILGVLVGASIDWISKRK
jgi:hypothetical protein